MRFIELLSILDSGFYAIVRIMTLTNDIPVKREIIMTLDLSLKYPESMVEIITKKIAGQTE